MPDKPLPAKTAISDNPDRIELEIRALRDFAELSSDWFWEQDAEFRFVRFFGISTEMLQRKQSEFIGKRRWDMPIHGVTPEVLAEHIAIHERHEAFRNFEYEVRGENGTFQYYSISGTPIFNAQGDFTGYHGIGRNLTKLRHAERSIKESEQYLSQIVDGSSIPTFVIDAYHRITHWNQACVNITGIAAQPMLGSKALWRAFYTEQRPTLADLVVDSASDALIAQYYPTFSHSALIASAVEAEHFFPKMGKNGRWLYFTAAPLRNSDGNLIGAIETLQDITDQKNAKKELEELAKLDGLTGVANRRRFDEILATEWQRAQRNSLSLSLLMIDVDHFKRYNDAYGHQAGDICLQKIAGALNTIIYRPGDLVARYGGEEFSIILTATDAQGATIVAQRILEHIAELAIPHRESNNGYVTLSIGIAEMTTGADLRAETLISAADSALYSAKHAGRNRFSLEASRNDLPIHTAPYAHEDSAVDQASFASEISALRDFAELSSDWFWEQDAEFRFTEFAGISTDKLRRKKSGFFGKRRWDMPISGITDAQLAEHIATCERHEAFRDFEYQIPSDEGTPQYYCISGSPVFNAHGVFTGYHGVGRNITALRLAEQRLKDSERYLSQIVDGSSIPTFVIDSEHRVTHWNQACVSLTGLDAQQMLGSNEVWRAFYPTPRPTMADLVLSGAMDDAVAEHYQKFTRSTLIDGAVEAENFHPEMGESGRWLYFTAAPLSDANGKLSGALETIQDVTDKKRDQKLLEDRTEALQEAHDGLEKRVAERTVELSQQLHFLQQLIEAIPGPVYYKDASSHYLGCNSAYEAFTGRSAGQIIGKTPRDITSRELADTYLAADRELLENPGKQIYESQVRYANGEMREVMFHKATFTKPDGSVGGLVGLMLDITERKRMEDNLRQAATVFDSCAEGVSISTPDGTIIAVNRAFTEITGYAAIEVIGRNPRMLQSGRHNKNFYREMWGCVSRDGRWQGEIWNRRKNGEIFPEWISITAVRNNKGAITNYVATFSDITEQKKNEERIQLLAFSDPLTGLPNRRLLLDRLQHALVTSVRKKRHGALLFIDLDDFKGINDTRGHDIGDLLLQQVALRISDCVREGDTVARLGGDEFVVILEDLGNNSLEATGYAESVAAKVLQSLNQPYALDTFQYHGTPSIGVTLFGDQQNTLEELLKQADLAMYRAKGSGRNAVRFFDPEMQSVVSLRVAMEADLRQGLLQNQFILHYQPQVNHTSHVTGAEALLRWAHPVRGMVPPGDFIPLAEETGLILPLGLWVLETSCAQLSAWGQQPETAHLTIAVNVSARQFRHQDFVRQVKAALTSTGAAPGKLKLELTESVLLDDVDDVIAKMSELKACGVCFSLDDFGTGYSSLSYLKRLPLDQLKIDQSFVRDVLVDANNAAIARTIVALAHSLGLNVIAEGVETEDQLLFLATHGCHAYQGYLFSKPLPLEQFEVFLKRE
jgi:diguanylate cyclase (GGDEF)-like protein/PAS domain S-box-containing protein